MSIQFIPKVNHIVQGFSEECLKSYSIIFKEKLRYCQHSWLLISKSI